MALDQNRRPVFVRRIVDTPRPNVRVELPQQVMELSPTDRDELATYRTSNRPEFTDLQEQIAKLEKTIEKQGVTEDLSANSRTGT